MTARYSTWSSLVADASLYWSDLTPEEILQAQKSEDCLHRVIREKYGIPDTEVKDQIDSFLKRKLG